MTIRIYNDPSDNRTFVRQMVHAFEIFDGIDELKESMFELCKAFFADHVSLQDVDVLCRSTEQKDVHQDGSKS